MKLSQSFLKTLRNAPKDESSKNAELLIRAGYIHKELAGVYDYLPLGLKVLENIKNIIRKELNKIGGEELLMSSLQNPELWQKTDRWDDQKVDIWFKTKLNAGGEVGLAPTHEEPLTSLLKDYVSSYKDLPLAIYQFQTKFRNELRAKSGIMRTRDFLMKDLYSFHTSEADLDAYYEKVEKAYENIYRELGIGAETHETFASGGVFSKYSHEFQTFLPVGEDTVYYNEDCSVVLNEEVLNDEVLADLNISRSELKETRAAEVGNIFKLKFKYSEPLGLNFIDQENTKKTVYMGCYGIGVSRVMGVIVEKFADGKGLVWPENIAPFKYYLIAIGEEGEKIAEKLYENNEDHFIYDERNLRPGEKFADAELLGIPYRVVVSDKTLAEGKIEVTSRMTGEKTLLTVEEFINKI